MQFIAAINVDRQMVVVEVECDCQGHCRFGRREDDHEQRKHLSVETQRRVPRKRDEVQVCRVEYQLDSHQDPNTVSFGRHAHDAADKQYRANE